MGRKEEENEAMGLLGNCSTRYIVMAVISALASGPLLCVTIHQVCVSKCLIRRRLPKLGGPLDDVLLIGLFILFVLLNFVSCCIMWTLVCRATKSIMETWACPDPPPKCPATLKDPKVLRSGRPYGYRTARYVRSQTAARPTKKSMKNDRLI